MNIEFEMNRIAAIDDSLESKVMVGVGFIQRKEPVIATYRI